MCWDFYLLTSGKYTRYYMAPKLYSRNVRWGPQDGSGPYCVGVCVAWGVGPVVDVWSTTGPLRALCIWWCALGWCVSDGCQWWTPWLALAISPSGGQFDSTHFDVSQNGVSDWRRHLVKVLKVHLRLTMTYGHSALNQHIPDGNGSNVAFSKKLNTP